MYRVLPQNPSLEALQKQARELQRAVADGDESCRDSLRQLNEFRNPSGEILPAKVKLTQAQFALAPRLRISQLAGPAGFRDMGSDSYRRGGGFDPAYHLLSRSNRRTPGRTAAVFAHRSDMAAGHGQSIPQRVHVLVVLDGFRSSRVVDVNDQSLSMVVENSGEPIESVGVASVDESLEALAQMHQQLAARAPALRPVWHTEVSEAWFFSTFSPRRLEDLLQTQMADVLDSIDWLVCFGEKVEAGFCHRQTGRNRLRRSDGQIVFHGFEFVHRRQSMDDVEDLVRPVAVRERVDLNWWISGWDRYMQVYGKRTETDLTVFLYLILRRICRRLAKSDVSSESFQAWLIQTAVEIHGELRRMGQEPS